VDALVLRADGSRLSPPPTDARSLLREARALYAEHPELRAGARSAGHRGFSSGAQWMRIALEHIRSKPVAPHPAHFQWLGLVKYGLAVTASVAFAIAMIALRQPVLSLAAILVFYAVEAQFVFLFPLALDGVRQPLRASRRWTLRAGGTLVVMWTVMQLALTMVLGGFIGSGFVRSWCVGCLAVCVWYERLRTAPHAAPWPLLEIGLNRPLLVRRERIATWNLAQPLRVLYVSDLHLGWPWTRRVARQLVDAVRASRPDVVLLGGDLADWSAGIAPLGRCVRVLRRMAPVYAISGNHDRRANVAKVRTVVESAGGRWLDQRAQLDGWPIELVPDAPMFPDRSASTRRILCGHNPAVFARDPDVDLVLAGHLHGGQCVLFTKNDRHYPGAWFARWTGLRYARDKAQMIVSRGAADTFPIRWNCPREVLLCELS
jgi:predicted MPP superfamily phosphohydrolase